MGVEVLRGQKGHPKPALDHVKGGGGAAGAADDVRLKARPAAGGEAQLRGHLAGLVENEVLPPQLPQADLLTTGQGVDTGDCQGVVILPQLDELQAGGQLGTGGG